MMGNIDINSNIETPSPTNITKNSIKAYKKFAHDVQSYGVPLRIEFVINYLQKKDIFNRIQEAADEFLKIILKNDIIYIATNDEYNNYVKLLNQNIEELDNAIIQYTKPPTKLNLTRIKYAESELLFLLSNNNTQDKGIKSKKTDYTLIDNNNLILLKIDHTDINKTMARQPFMVNYLVHLYNSLPQSIYPKKMNGEIQYEKMYSFFQACASYGLTFCGILNNNEILPNEIRPEHHLTYKYLTSRKSSDKRWKLSVSISIKEFSIRILHPANICGQIILNNFFTEEEQSEEKLRLAVCEFIENSGINVFPSLILFGYRENFTNITSFHWSQITTEEVDKSKTIIGSLKSLQNLTQKVIKKKIHPAAKTLPFIHPFSEIIFEQSTNNPSSSHD